MPPSLSSTPATQSANEPLEVFISYSHQDEALKNELTTHLTSLKREGKIKPWHDHEVEAGSEWDAEIKAKLESAQMILLLISPSFIASEYCYVLEMQRAMERHQEGTARVIPIILRPSDWKTSPFNKLKALPEDGKPITRWDDRDEAFLNVVQRLRRAVESLSKK
ncbi:MAG: toll/interleukin-1 receptor domain-containing protein [Elainellaceae cyanobacterium]